jgi:hypothetical protein
MERISRDVQRELSRFGPSAGLVELLAAWPDVVGPEIARNAWPARIGRDRTLHVATSSSAWAFELGQLAERVLEQLRESLGEATPTGLRFAVGKLPEPSDPTADDHAASPREPTSGEQRQADSIAASIEAAELRETVAKAVARGLARASADRSV